ncbi:MAG: YjbH domain-containing protein, partial [Candidatus Cloacimonetes bacterium]|nr:YjbH domain-containing protein [Candidatus Cloacimonadota bacterium]
MHKNSVRKVIYSAKILILFLVLFFSFSTISAYELTQLVDIPTAGIIEKGDVKFNSSLFKNGGVTFGAGVGVLPRFMFGLQYGGEKIIGSRTPSWDSYPGVLVKYRLLDESPKLPALSLGFDSRGFGCFTKETEDSIKVERFEIKSKGFYAVLSQNYEFMGNLGVHAGVNYSIENKDDDDDLNMFIGIDKSINNQIGAFLEYDFAFNDNDASGDEEHYKFGEKNGYLNAAFYFNVSQHLKLVLNFRDLLGNQYNN